MASSGMSARAWWLFAAVSVLWGIPYLFIKLAVEDISPVWVAFGRIVVAFAVLLPYAWHKGALRGLGRHWKPLLIYSVVEICLPWPLIGFGEQRVSSGLAAILIAAVPLIVALMALRIDHEERAEGARLVGLIVGFTGVIVLLGLDVAGRPGELLGALAILLAAVGYAAGTDDDQAPLPRDRSARPDDGLDGHLRARAGAGGGVLGAGGDAVGARRCCRSRARARLQRARLPAVLRADPRGRPRRATVITFVNPVVAVALGIALLGEGLGPSADRGAAADPRRLVALDRRADAARPDDARGRAPPARRGAAAAHLTRPRGPALMDRWGSRDARRSPARERRGWPSAPDARGRGCRSRRSRRAMGLGIDLTPQGLRTPGVLQDYTALRVQPWAPPLIARATHVRFWVDWPFVQPDGAIALGDPANPGLPHLQALDAQVDAVVADGLEAILMPWRYPRWVNHTGSTSTASRRSGGCRGSGHGPEQPVGALRRGAVAALLLPHDLLRGRQRAQPPALATG